MHLINEKIKVALLDDDAQYSDAMLSWLEFLGYQARGFLEPEPAFAALEKGELAVVVVDLWMPGHDGVAVVQRIREIAPSTEVVVLTGSATVETAIQTLKLGVYDYVTKSVESERLAHVLRGAVEKWRLSRESRELRKQVSELHSELDRHVGQRTLIGRSAAMEQVRVRVAAAGRTRGTVLVRGESGTGKELVARAIHQADAARPFVPVNCAALPRDLIEAELFGHRRGAFTGADGRSEGLFLAANGGTLFLDEITEMAADVQSKLLRALQERSVRPVGATAEVPVDVRIVASTNRDPQEAVATGTLREDLFYRLSVVTIELPPLRDRPEDVPLLAEHFLRAFRERNGGGCDRIERDALRALVQFRWPGNVRELQNAIEHACTFATGSAIGLSDLPRGVVDAPAKDPGVMSLKEAERRAIEQALAALDGNKSRVAEALGISRKHLYTRMRSLGLDPRDD